MNENIRGMTRIRGRENWSSVNRGKGKMSDGERVKNIKKEQDNSGSLIALYKAVICHIM